MVIKYYGHSVVNHYVGWTSCRATTSKLFAADPYKNVSGFNPSYCVWIVPGTVDANGDDTTFGLALV